jgi:hypothetical protein
MNNFDLNSKKDHNVAAKKLELPNMKKLLMLPPLIMLLVAIGCATTDKVMLDETVRAPTTSIQVFKGAEIPQKKYKEIATMSFLGPREDELKALRNFVKRGKQMGANGIIVEEPSSGGVKGGLFGVSSSFLFKARAIVFEE